LVVRGLLEWVSTGVVLAVLVVLVVAVLAVWAVTVLVTRRDQALNLVSQAKVVVE
jgi:hypothetical protein